MAPATAQNPHNKALSGVQEMVLIKWIQFLDDKGFPSTPPTAVGLANSIRMRDDPAAQPPSPKWLKRWLTSQELNGLVPRKMNSIEAARDAAYDQNSITFWFASLEAVPEVHALLSIQSTRESALPIIFGALFGALRRRQWKGTRQ
jgi:hypothetical protein